MSRCYQFDFAAPETYPAIMGAGTGQMRSKNHEASRGRSGQIGPNFLHASRYN